MGINFVSPLYPDADFPRNSATFPLGLNLDNEFKSYRSWGGERLTDRITLWLITPCTLGKEGKNRWAGAAVAALVFVVWKPSGAAPSQDARNKAGIAQPAWFHFYVFCDQGDFTSLSNLLLMEKGSFDLCACELARKELQDRPLVRLWTGASVRRGTAGLAPDPHLGQLPAWADAEPCPVPEWGLRWIGTSGREVRYWGAWIQICMNTSTVPSLKCFDSNWLPNRWLFCIYHHLFMAIYVFTDVITDLKVIQLLICIAIRDKDTIVLHNLQKLHKDGLSV